MQRERERGRGREGERERGAYIYIYIYDMTPPNIHICEVVGARPVPIAHSLSLYIYT